jgi:cation diffusion facilitator CzcD-associated flavoprotein CzcO
VLATGFDAVTGPFERIDIQGEGGARLVDAWTDGPQTFLGLGVADFPNLFILVGPHNAATFCNMPRCIEHNVEWVATLLEHMSDLGLTRVAVEAEAQQAWTAEVHEAAERMLFSKVESWFTGKTSASVPTGERSVLLYTGGFPRFQERCEAVAAEGYAGFELT